MRDRDVYVGGLRLRVREYEREASAVLFLHFGGGNLMMWQRVVPYFQDHYRLILVDLRGHGKSDKSQAGSHIDQMADDVAGMMEQLALERAHVVGSSLGAEVGLSLAARHPEKVISLACDGALCSEYGPYGVWEGSEAEFQEYVARELAPLRGRPQRVFPSVAAMLEARKQAFEEGGWWNSYMEAHEEYDVLEIGEGQCTRSWQNVAMLDYMEHYFDYRFEDYYRRVTCPLLMLPGQDDLQNERFRTVMQALAQLAPQARIVEVPGWIHPYGWLLDPEEMVRVVLDFMAEAGG